RRQLRQAYEDLSRLEQPLQASHAKQWEALNTAFHEALLCGHDSPWTVRMLRLLARQSERYRRYAISLPGSQRDVHMEHRVIYESALAGNELRAALALEAHIQGTADLVTQALNRSPDQAPPPRPGTPPQRPAAEAGRKSVFCSNVDKSKT
ncbi:MAG: FCD domain-containing protein, partial [Comamonadaceae bacterium]|nr:FCD domain-containing protein [Comamonadaceae bacterium]